MEVASEGRLVTSDTYDPGGEWEQQYQQSPRQTRRRQMVQLEEVIDVQLGSLNHWKRTLGMEGSENGWEVFTVEDRSGVEEDGGGCADTSQAFIDERKQSWWVMEFLWSVQMNLDQEASGEVCEVEQSDRGRFPSGDPGPENEEELAFGNHVGFSTEQRPAEYRRQIQRNVSEVRKTLWEFGLSQLIGDYEMTEEQKWEVELLIYTWRDLFVLDPMEMPITDLVMHTIPTYNDAKPVRTKEIVYSQREIQW